MTTAPISDETCAAFDGAPRDLDPDTLHRFVVGRDAAPVGMERDEVEAQLDDPFASLLLARSRFPRTGDELLAAIDQATADGDPLRHETSFVLGEGIQLPNRPGLPGTNRGIRCLVTRGSASQGIDLLSTYY